MADHHADYHPDPRILELGEGFYDPVEAAQFPQAAARFHNERWARRIGLGDLTRAEWEAHFARFEPLEDNLETPLALRYHGHQFRVYNPEIGDGRGFLFAQVRDAKGRLLDLATKGSGQTPYSRTGDGRLTLQGGVREILAAQRLEALGVETSKPFAFYETGEDLVRHDEPSPARSGVLTRLGWSHIRIGTFQRHAFEDRADRIAALMDHCIAAYYPALESETEEARASAFLRAVTDAHARLAAQWMAAGFVHGVLNSDNLNVTGESFDYGPWRFLPHYEPGFTAAYFDEGGLYAYGRQPDAVFWNLQQLGACLGMVAGDTKPLVEALQTFPETYEREVKSAFLARLGVLSAGGEGDAELLRAMLAFLRESQAPWERFFYDWFGGEASAERASGSPEAARYDGDAFDRFHTQLLTHAPDRPQRLQHLYFKRGEPSTLVYEDHAALWKQIAEDDDWSGFDEKLADIELMRRGLSGEGN